jgi:hypothetical protein
MTCSPVAHHFFDFENAKTGSEFHGQDMKIWMSKNQKDQQLSSKGTTAFGKGPVPGIRAILTAIRGASSL